MENNPPKIEENAAPPAKVRGKVGRKPGGHNKLSKKQERALKAVLIDGLSIRDACKVAGYSEPSYYAAIKKPHVKQAMWDIINDRNVADAALSRRVLAELAEDASNSQVRYQAALALADRLGGLPAAEPVNTGGPTINAHSITIVPYGQQPPAQLIDNQQANKPKPIDKQQVIDVVSDIEPVGHDGRGPDE